MTVRKFAEELGLRVYTDSGNLERDIQGAYVSDLLSDVMGNAGEGQIWITLQSHVNVVAIASLKELAALVFVKGIEPEEKVIKKAREEGIPLLGTHKGTFETAGRLYQILNS